LKQWLEKIRQMKRDQILIVLLAGILLLVIAMPSGTEEQGDDGTAAAVEVSDEPAAEDEKERLENQLQELLARVSGVGEVRVMITLKSDGKKIVEKDLEQSQNEEQGDTPSSSAQSSEETVYQKDSQGNEIPYVTEQEAPEVAGVLVIAQGGGNASVKQEITEAVMALFGVEAHKIKVMRME
jgi:stage III sporulation protein AG